MPEHHPGQVEQTKWKTAEGAGKGQTAKSGQFCSLCGAWRGQLGLEPTFELYIKHLYDEVFRILRPDGTCFVNLADTYSSGLTSSLKYAMLRQDLSIKEKKYVGLELSRELQKVWQENGQEACKRLMYAVLPKEIPENQKIQRKTENILSKILSCSQKRDKFENNTKKFSAKNGNHTTVGREMCVLRGDQTGVFNARPHQGRRPERISKSNGNFNNIPPSQKRRIPKEQISNFVLELQRIFGNVRLLSTLKFNKSNIPQQLKPYFLDEKAAEGVPAKSLCLIPQRFAIEMINRGWILRNTVIWHKPNPMPSSAKDRFTVDFEYVFFFVKSNKTLYWIRPDGKMASEKPDAKSGIEDLDWQRGTRKGKPVKLSLWKGYSYWFEPIYEPYLTESNAERPRMGQGQNTKYKQKRNYGGGGSSFLGHSGTLKADGTQIQKNPLGRNKRCVWAIESRNNYEIVVKEDGKVIFGGSGKLQEEMVEQLFYALTQNKSKDEIKGTTWRIPTQAFPEAHFATFPEKLVEPMILAGCPEFVCKKCGMGRRKVYDRPKPPDEAYTKARRPEDRHIASSPIGGGRGSGGKMQKWLNENPPTFKGYTDCGCKAGFRYGIVLDPS